MNDFKHILKGLLTFLGIMNIFNFFEEIIVKECGVVGGVGIELLALSNFLTNFSPND